MTTEQQENARRMRDAWAMWDATKGTDLSMWDEYMSDDISFFSLAAGDESLPFTSGRNGRDEVMGYLEGLTGAFTMGHWRLEETIAEGDRVVGIGTTGWTNNQTGKSFVTPMVLVTRWRDGRMTEYAEFYDTAKIAASTV